MSPSSNHLPPRGRESHVLLGLPSSLLFPHDVSAVDVRRPENVRAFEGMAPDTLVLVGALERPDATEEERAQLVLPVGTLARLVSHHRLPAGSTRVVLQGLRRAHVQELCADERCLWALPQPIEATAVDPVRAEQALARLRHTLAALSEHAPDLVGELPKLIPLYGEDLDRLTDLIASVLPLDYPQQARLLGEVNPMLRLEFLQEILDRRSLRASAERSVEKRLAGRLQRDVLREKFEALRDELGEPGTRGRELERHRERLARLEAPEAARSAFEQELDVLRRATPGTPSWARIQNHLEWALDLPWGHTRSDDDRPFAEVLRALDRSHVGLEEVKKRIAEILAIRELGGGARGTVLCFLGPPGTGKSSIARAVASALGRSFLTIPVGAMTSERELVGTPSQRDGATPGAILTGIHRLESVEPVILLDEIDKLSLGGEGTAAGALLHLFDPEHNAEFLDHYLGQPFDLSRCLFLATANDIDEIPDTLLDRMELIPFHGYTDSEKYAIARQHLLPRAHEHAGIEKNELRLSPGALRALIDGYTEEAGVRHLNRLINSLARKAAVDVVNGGDGLSVRKQDLRELLGPRTVEEEIRLRRPTVGVATGLAWTSVGGTMLPIETLVMHGAGRTILTGQIGEVMRESVQTALSYVRTYFAPAAAESEAEGDWFESVDLHLHFPSAATPKDGPSAGTAIVTAIVSLLSGRPTRHDVAMTGELSLFGAVLPVGGLREKLLAAIRCGIREVCVPAGNREDVLRLPQEIRDRLTIHSVANVEQVLALALAQPRGSQPSGASGALGTHRRIARRAQGPGGCPEGPGSRPTKA